MTVYDFSADLNGGETIRLADYAGKVLCIVNTASKCGFTPQYEGLEYLYKTYKERGFLVLGFPCNQFAEQEPGTDEEIRNFCTLNFGVTFPLFKKIDVNGENAHPLYKFLTSALQPGGKPKPIKWNFTKFLVNREGVPVKRYAPLVKPKRLIKKIEDLL